MAALAAPASAAPTGPVELLSVNADGDAAGDDQSQSTPSVSDDGRYAVFTSRATDLVDGFVDANGANFGDVFLRDRQTGETTLVSYGAGSPTTTATGGSSGNGVISDNGAYIVYDSFATNIVPGQTDNNAERDVFVYSVSSGENTLVSHSDGSDSTTCDNGQSLAADISDDGAYIAYQSLCDDLVENQNAGGAFTNIFLYDRATNTNIDVVSRPNAVNPNDILVGDGNSLNPDISGEGNVVVYTTAATNIGAGDGGNLVNDIGYYRQPVGNLPTVSTTLTFGTNGASSGASVSDDGVYVAFDTDATNIDGTTDNNNSVDVALATVPVGLTPMFEYVSYNTADNDTGDGFSQQAEISGDGSYIAFRTTADDIVDAAPLKADDTFWDVVRYGRNSGDIELASHNIPGNAGGDGDSAQPNSTFVGLGISDDGNTVVYTSEAENLDNRDNNNFTDIFATDFPSGDVTLLSTNANASASGNDDARNPTVSSSGAYATFQSEASDHTALTDNNNDPDGFIVGEFVPEEDDLILSIAPATVIEGDDGTVDMTFDVSLSGPAPGPDPVTASYATTDGSATGGPSSGPGIDYRTSSGTVSIPSGSSSGTITVPVYGDTDIEPDETFTVTLTNPSSGVMLGSGFATGTITDDDEEIVMVQDDNVLYDGVNDTLRVNLNQVDGATTADTTSVDIALNYSRALYATPEGPQPRGAGQPAPREALLATSAVFADALASGVLQGNTLSGGRPLLVTDTNSLSPSVLTELDRLDVGTVHILGGVNAISQTVEDSLTSAGYTVNRFQGPSRLETAIAIAGGAYPDATTAILARAFAGPSGDDTQAFADSIAAGAWAASRGWPLLLSQTEVLSTSTREYLDSSNITTVYIAGGTAAISTDVETTLSGMGINVIRTAGPSRFDTALAIANARGYDSESDASQVMLLEGQAQDAWVAGFTGAGYSAIHGAPIVLGVTDVIPGQTAEFLNPPGPSTPRFLVDEDNVTGYVLVCGIATERCDEGRGHLGLPSLATATEPSGDYAKGATATFELSGTYDSSGYRTTINCGGPTTEISTGGATSHTEGQPANTIGVTIPADTPSGPCVIAVVLTYSNGSAQTVAATVNVTD